MVRGAPHSVTFEMSILGGVLHDELFVPAPKTRLTVRCDESGGIFVRILAGRTS